MPGVVPGNQNPSSVERQNSAAATGGGSTSILGLLPGWSQAQALVAFVGELSDWHLWASLGWLALGAILVVLGVYLWLKKADVIPAAVPVPVPV